LQNISPISRSVGNGQQTFFEEAGMTFTTAFGQPNSASIGPVGTDSTKTIIDYINLYHIVNAGRNVDVYRFDNPRIQSMSLDELDMSEGGGTGSEVSIEFNYDGLLIEAYQPIENYAPQLRDLTDGGVYPLKLDRLQPDSTSRTLDP
jgi:hypothetical protein